MNIINILKLTFIVVHGSIVVFIGLRATAIAFAESKQAAWRFFQSSAIKLIVLVLFEVGAFAYIRYGEPNWITVSRLQVSDKRLSSALEDKRLIQISDLHITHVGYRERQLIKVVNKQKADWILITGDLINDHTGWPAALEVISKLKANKGVYAVPGNTDNAHLTPTEFDEGLSEIGVQVLRNASVPLGGTGAWLIGVDDPVQHRDHLEQALKGLDQNNIPPAILIAHSSEVLNAAIDAKIPLVLTGHTHGGQVGISWLRNLSSYASRGKYMSGRYKEGETTLYVNRGIGWKKMPHRFLAAPEVTVVTFRDERQTLMELFGGRRSEKTSIKNAVTLKKLWLGDFESTYEHVIRWKIDGVSADQADEYATRGSHSVRLTYKPGQMGTFFMDTYLSVSGRQSDWRKFSTLHFDITNVQSSSEKLHLFIHDSHAREHRMEIALDPKKTQHVVLNLDQLNPAIDRGNIVRLQIVRQKSSSPAIFYLDAVYLEPKKEGSSSEGVGRVSRALNDAAITPNMLGGWRFIESIDQWLAKDEPGSSIVRIPLSIVGPKQPLSIGFSISGGIPFAMGQLGPDDAVRLNDVNGAIWPVQTRTLATWEDGSVKWLLVTGIVPEFGRGRKLTLEYGPTVTTDRPPVEQVIVTQNDDAVTVTTGPLQFTVSKKRFALFDSASVDRDEDGTFSESERLVSSGDLTMMHNGKTYRSSLDTKSYKLEIEEEGPLRVTLKMSGSFRDERGEPFGQFIVRIHAYAGLPQVKLFHTFIYTGYPANEFHHLYKGRKLPSNETIEEIALEMPITMTQAASVITADERKSMTLPLDEKITISQYAHDAYRFGRENEWEVVEGAKNVGWMLVQNNQAGIMVGIRNVWQEYPKELSVDPSTRKFTIKLWPESAGELNLETGPEAYGPGAVARGSAFGLAKTHELWFSFLGVPINDKIAGGLAGLWQEPWLLMSDPEWLQASNAWGPIGPVEPDRFNEQEAMLEDLLHWAIRQPKDFNWYGMLDYGDTRVWYRKRSYDKSYDEWGWHPEGRWGWHNNEAMGLHAGLLVSFFRTQDLETFEFAEAKTRHVMDVDTVHYNTVANDPRLSKKISDTFSQVGSTHRHNAYHWGGRNEEATHVNVTGLLMYYYLTGYERAREVADEVGDFLLRNPVTYDKHPDIAPLRGIANVVWGDVLMYQQTWDQRYRVAADRWVQVLLEGQRGDGAWLDTYNPLTMNWNGEIKNNYIVFHVLPALIAYHRLTGNPEVAEAIVKATLAMIKSEPYLQFFDALAYTSLMTGNGEYMNEGLRRARALLQRQHFRESPVWDGMVFNKATYDRVGPVLYSVPFILGSMDIPNFADTEAQIPKKLPLIELQDSDVDSEEEASDQEVEASDVIKYEVLVVSSLEKVIPNEHKLSGASTNSAQLSLARGEYESVQLVLRSDIYPLENITFELSDLKQINGSGVISREYLDWSPVGFVKTTDPDYDVSHVGWWPDPIPRKESFDAFAGWWQPIWVTVFAPEGTPAGVYSGKAVIQPGNAQAHEVELKVTVWDFDLPKTPSLKTAFDLYINRIESAYAEFFPEWWEKWEPHLAELTQLFYDDMLKYRISPILNWDVSTPQAIAKLQSMHDEGLSAFAVGHFGGSFDNKWPKDDLELEMLQPTFRYYAHQLRDANLLDRHYIYMYDEPEPGDANVARIGRMIHDADPDLKNLVTIRTEVDVDELGSWFDDIDIVTFRNAVFDPEQAQKLRNKGKELWLYVSGPKPPFPTLSIDYPAIAYRILPWMCWKYDITGLLYWSVNYWTTDPYKNPMNTRWNQNGNGSLFYPGPEGPVGSVRLEVLRDGIEDYEYLMLLRKQSDKVRANSNLTAQPEVKILLGQAERLLRIEDSLVESMRYYTKEPKQLIKRREEIAFMIETLQQLLR